MSALLRKRHAHGHRGEHAPATPRPKGTGTIATPAGVRHAAVLGIGGYRPTRVVDNHEICQVLDSTDEWIRERSGIAARHQAGPDESVVDMATSAGRAALEAAGVALPLLSRETDAFMARPGERARAAGAWAATRATFGALLGLAPHVLHHVGFLAGAALLTGVVGNTVLYAAGMLLSIPMLNRLRKRFGTWKAPALGAIAFTSLFTLSAFVIGPALNPTPVAPQPASTTGPTGQPLEEHDGHHPDTNQTRS